ncbi:uncharacterized protein LOC119323025 [Triticum dicoccoides]|uniref:uncharacterized protein LOC119323025 n=1 Tax=Triticum dicoccoides TaxID=85692 RepID=UPI00188F01B0|nr:uncharacterized protein LOC119323025 [Triticum dicoccoides]
MEAPSGEITSDKAAGLTNGLVDSSETTDDVHLPGFLSAAMVQDVGSYSKDPVSTHSTTTRSSVYFLDVDWSGSLKFLFIENPTKNYPWTGHVVKPFKPFDLDAMHKCAARLIINAFPVEVEEFLEGYQVEPGMIRPFKAARKQGTPSRHSPPYRSSRTEAPCKDTGGWLLRLRPHFPWELWGLWL